MENNAQKLSSDQDLIARQNIHLNARVSSQGSNFRIRQSQSPDEEESPPRRKKIQQHSWEEIKKLKKYNLEKEEQQRLAEIQKQKDQAMAPKKVVKKKTKKTVKKKEATTPKIEEINPDFKQPLVQNLITENKKQESSDDGYDSEQNGSNESLFHEVEQLKDNVEELQLQMATNQRLFDEFTNNFMAKASEKTIAFYLRKIAGSLHRECGDKVYQASAESGLGNQSQMDKIYQSEDSLLLKDGAQQLYDKFQIIGMNLVNQKKYKKSSQQQIYRIEESLKGAVRKETFGAEIEGIEKRLRQSFEKQIDQMQSSLIEYKLDLTKNVQKFESEVEDTKKKTIWKIQDVEKLIEQRISEQKVNDLLESLDTKLNLEIQMIDTKHSEQLEQKILDCKTQQDTDRIDLNEKLIDVQNLYNSISTEIYDSVRMLAFRQQTARIDGMKQFMEGEMDTLQIFVRDSKDKTAELIKKFELVVESVQTNAADQTMGGNTLKVINQNFTMTPKPLKLTPPIISALPMPIKTKTPITPPIKTDSDFPNSAKQVKEVNFELPVIAVIEPDDNNDIAELRIGLEMTEDKKDSSCCSQTHGDEQLKPMPQQLFARSMSIRQAGPLSRKCKADLIERKIMEFEEVVQAIEDHIRAMQFQIEAKCDKDLADIIREDKVSKTDFGQYLPDYLQQEEISNQIRSICNENNSMIHQQFDEIKQSVDGKLVKIRQEYDVGTLRRQIREKAPMADFSDFKENMDFKMNLLDDNFLLLAKDLETFQRVSRKMNTSIGELQMVQKDVLLGKKNSNCLSCTKGPAGLESQQHVLGKDGQLYVSDLNKPLTPSDFSNAGGHQLKIDDANATDQGTLVLENSQLVSPVSKTVGKTRVNSGIGQRVSGQTFKGLSLSTQGKPHDSTQESGNFNLYSDQRRGQVGKNSFGARQLKNQSVAKKSSKMELQNDKAQKSYRNRRNVNRSAILNTTSAGTASNPSHSRLHSGIGTLSQTRRNHQPKLPIGFLVQNELKQEFTRQGIPSAADISVLTQSPHLGVFQSGDYSQPNQIIMGLAPSGTKFNRVRPMTGKVSATNTRLGIHQKNQSLMNLDTNNQQASRYLQGMINAGSEEVTATNVRASNVGLNSVYATSSYQYLNKDNQHVSEQMLLDQIPENVRNMGFAQIASSRHGEMSNGDLTVLTGGQATSQNVEAYSALQTAQRGTIGSADGLKELSVRNVGQPRIDQMMFIANVTPLESTFETKEISIRSPPQGDTGQSQPISYFNQDAMAAEEILEQAEIENVYINEDNEQDMEDDEAQVAFDRNTPMQHKI